MNAYSMSAIALGFAACQTAHALALPCENSPTGLPVIVEQEFVCDVRYAEPAAPDLAAQTFGIVNGFEILFRARFPTDAEKLGQMLGETSLHIPEQTVEFVFTLQQGQKVPATVRAAPVVWLEPGIESLCALRFRDVEFNVTSVESPYLPVWVAEGVRSILTSHEKLRQRALETMNEKIGEAVRPYCLR